MVKLTNLRTGEKVEFVIRRHWIVFVLVGLYGVFGVFVTTCLLGFFGLQTWVLLLLSIFWMFFSVFLYIQWLNHELDLFVVTNNRVICVEQKSFLNRTVGECNLGQVQEVTSETKGFFSNIFNYGTILVKTAGNTRSFDMTFAPEPLGRSRKMLNIVDHYRDTHSFRNAEMAAQKVEESEQVKSDAK
jgi:hypothetical protein